MIDGDETRFINVPMEFLLELTKKSIDNEQSVWFASDFSNYISPKYNLLDTSVYDYSSINSFNQENTSKKNNLLYKLSAPNHAMLIIGYNIYNKTIDKWLVENSHGNSKDVYKKIDTNVIDTNGNLTMTHQWFKDYVYGIVVKKKYLPKSILNVLKRNPIDIDPWSTISCELLFYYQI